MNNKTKGNFYPQAFHGIKDNNFKINVIPINFGTTTFPNLNPKVNFYSKYFHSKLTVVVLALWGWFLWVLIITA